MAETEIGATAPSAGPSDPAPKKDHIQLTADEGKKDALAQPDTLGLAEGEKKEEPKLEKGDQKPTALAYDLKVPEGVEVDEKDMGWLKEVAAENRLPPEAAQKLLDRAIERERRAAEEPIKLWVETQNTWKKEVESDKEIGGDNLPAVKATVAKALDQFGGPGLREALILTGAGNNPAIIKFVHKMAKELVEGSAGPTGNPPRPNRSAAERMYPNLPTGEM